MLNENTQEVEVRAFGRHKARELTPEEMDAVSGACPFTITCPCDKVGFGDETVIFDDGG